MCTGELEVEPAAGEVSVRPPGEIETELLVLALAPMLSVTVAVTRYVPAALYMCPAVGPAALPPSPKSITDDAMFPSPSLDPAVDAVTEAGTTAWAGLTVSAASGGWLAATLTV